MNGDCSYQIKHAPHIEHGVRANGTEFLWLLFCRSISAVTVGVVPAERCHGGQPPNNHPWVAASREIARAPRLQRSCWRKHGKAEGRSQGLTFYVRKRWEGLEALRDEGEGVRHSRHISMTLTVNFFSKFYLLKSVLE